MEHQQKRILYIGLGLVFVFGVILVITSYFDRETRSETSLSQAPSQQKIDRNNLEQLSKNTVERINLVHFSNGLYKNYKYNFQIEVPQDWSLFSFDDEQRGAPNFVFYKRKSSHDLESEKFISVVPGNDTYVSLYPLGVGREGIAGERRPSKVKLDVTENVASDYYLVNGNTWGTLINFQERPKSWNESGFIFASNTILDKQEDCTRKGEIIPMSQCALLDKGDVIEYSGNVPLSERAIIENILSSFKFIY